MPQLNFIYYDLPNWLRFWKKGSKGIHLYYFLWQLGIVKIARKYDKKINFDFIHHITFVSLHQPSFLYKLNKKFIFGPVAGGEITPQNLFESFSIKYKLKELFKIFYNRLKSIDIFMIRNFKSADLIFVTSKDSKNLIPKKYHYKVRNKLAIGIQKFNIPLDVELDTNKFNIIYIGRFIHWKGIQLAIEAVKKIDNPNIIFSLIGKGEYKEILKNMGLSTNSNIVWEEWISQKELFSKIKNSDCLLFPSYHDSGGMVVLESMANGVPVICLDLGGPGQIVNDNCGRVISTNNKTKNQIIDNLFLAIKELYDNPILKRELSRGAIKRANEYEWSKVVSETYDIIEKELLFR